MLYICSIFQLGVCPELHITWDFLLFVNTAGRSSTDLDLRMTEVIHGEGGVGGGSCMHYFFVLQQRSS